jgi:tetratricopeptide (TPR) repeat protein
MGDLMRFIRLAALAAVVASLGACATPQQQAQGGLPQTVTFRNQQTGTSTTIKGASAALAVTQVEMARRNYTGAVRAATVAIGSNQLQGNELSLAYSIRGDAYYMGGDAAKARDDWRTSVEMDGQNAIGLRGLAIISNMQRKFPEAMQYMERALAAAPNSAQLYITRGLLRLEERRALPQALADFDKAVQLKPDLASAYFYRGLANHMSGRYVQAKADYDKALDINPGEHRASQALALLERRQAPTALQPRSRSNEVVRF